ncbi:hypothetical protein HF086_012848 [Spodoptera exigua]|uniref:Kinesin motor domain-containing protein n=1 Tax=Spodoptera exigua TaxID=7107 RepID=A0A922MLY9_SPOEX|nr:hypothetical protein HF086_012848 [Spodoptera exigua]
MEKSARPRTALNECVKVVVRCRPLSEKEKNEGYEEVKKKRTEQTWYERLSTKTPVDNKSCDARLQVWTVAIGLVVTRALTHAGSGPLPH